LYVPIVGVALGCALAGFTNEKKGGDVLQRDQISNQIVWKRHISAVFATFLP